MDTYLVLGAGKIGQAVTHDLLLSDNNVVIVDNRPAALVPYAKDPRIRARRLDLGSTDIDKHMRESACAISCVPYEHNLSLTERAIAAGSHFCDLGGNRDIVDAQEALSDKAAQAGVAIVPDCGLAPGLVSILTAHAAAQLDTTKSINIRVGGLPRHPTGPLKYSPSFSIKGLINEYKEPCEALRAGKLIEIPSLDDLEELHFPGLPPLEAFNTSGGLSTLAKTFKEKIPCLDYKTIRYQGHCQKIRVLRDLGFLDEGRETTERLLEKTLPKTQEDIVLCRVEARGEQKGERITLRYELIDFFDPSTNLSAMQRCTGFSASIIAQMISDGHVKARGTLRQELHVPAEAFIDELYKRGLTINRYRPD